MFQSSFGSSGTSILAEWQAKFGFQSSLGPQAERYFAVEGRAPTQLVFQSSPSASFSPLAILPRRPHLPLNASFRSHRGQSFGVLTALVFHL